MPPPPRTPCRARSSSSLCKVGLLVLLALFHPSSAMHPIVGNLARGSMLRISADLSGGSSLPLLSLAPLLTAAEMSRGHIAAAVFDLIPASFAGLPLDHWKTRSVRFPNESPVESFKAIWVLSCPRHPDGSQRACGSALTSHGIFSAEHRGWIPPNHRPGSRRALRGWSSTFFSLCEQTFAISSVLTNRPEADPPGRGTERLLEGPACQGFPLPRPYLCFSEPGLLVIFFRSGLRTNAPIHTASKCVW